MAKIKKTDRNLFLKKLNDLYILYLSILDLEKTEIKNGTLKNHCNTGDYIENILTDINHILDSNSLRRIATNDFLIKSSDTDLIIYSEDYKNQN